MIDIAVAYNRFKFLGHEFLTWIWYLTEKDRELLRRIESSLESLSIGNRIVLENRYTEAVESIIIKGDDAGLEEGILALKKGAVVVDLNLLYQSDDLQWRFTLKGESLSIGALKPPETGPMETAADKEGGILEKFYLYEKVTRLVDALYEYYIRVRLTPEWDARMVPQIRSWIQGA